MGGESRFGGNPPAVLLNICGYLCMSGSGYIILSEKSTSPKS